MLFFPLLHRVWWKSSRHRFYWRQWFGRCFRVRSETSKPSTVMCAELLLHFPTLLLNNSTTQCAKAISHKRLYRTVSLPHGNTRTLLGMDALITAFLNQIGILIYNVHSHVHIDLHFITTWGLCSSNTKLDWEHRINPKNIFMDKSRVFNACIIIKMYYYYY